MIIEPSAYDLIEALFKRRGLFVATFLIVVGAGAAFLFLSTPRYKSEASLIVRFGAASDADASRDGGASLDPEARREIMQSHADILQSVDLARDVIEAIGLDKIYPGIMDERPWRWSGTAMDLAIREFEARLDVSVEPRGDVVAISFMHPNAAMAQLALQRIVDAYLRRAVAAFSGDGAQFEGEQLRQAADRLAKAQADLNAYKANGNIASFDDEIAELIRQRGAAQATLQAAQVALAQAAQRRDELRRQLRAVPATVAAPAGDRYRSLDDAQAKLADLRAKEQEMLITYRPESRMVAQLRASIAAAAAALAARRNEIAARDSSAPNVVYQNVQTDLLRATADAASHADTVAILTRQIADLEGRIADLEARRGGLDDRTRAVSIADASYRALALHVEDSRVAAGQARDHLSHGAVISAPTLPYQIASPRRDIFGPAFLIGGLWLAVLMALAAERLDRRFTATRQIGPVLRLPVLASLRRLG